MNKPLTFRTTWPFLLAAFALIGGPYLVAWLLTPPGKVFVGVLANHNDFSTYLSAMRQGADGSWLFDFTFSPERWQAQFLYPVYTLMGKIVPSFWGLAVWANVLRLVALGLVLVVFRWWLVRCVFPNEPTKQWVAWLLLLFGGGLGWLLWPLATLWGQTQWVFPDITDSGWTTILIGINAPHYLLGLAVETAFFGALWQVVAGKGWQWVGVTAVLSLLLCLTYAYNSTVLATALGLYGLWALWQSQRIPWQKWGQTAVILAPLLPFLFYYGYWINRDPVWVQYATNETHIPPPPWYALLWGAGLVGVAALVGLRRWLATQQNPTLIFWLASHLLMMYVLWVPYSGRFLLGFWVPVATLAAYSLEEVILPWLKKTAFDGRFHPFTPVDTLRRSFLILSMPSTLMVALFLIKNVSLIPDFPYYMPQSEITAMNWLATQTQADTDVILAYYPVGNYFPILSSTHVFMGQLAFTVHFNEKSALVEQFWQTQTTNEWRQAFLDEWHVTYVYEGVYEDALHEGSITPPGELVYDQEGVKIYRVTPLAK